MDGATGGVAGMQALSGPAGVGTGTGTGAGTGAGAASPSGGKLPYTGFPAAVVGAVGVALTGSGAALRRRLRDR